MAVGIFEAQAHLWTIFLQVEELLAVERSATLPGRYKNKRRHSTAEHVNVMRSRRNRSVQQRAPKCRAAQAGLLQGEGYKPAIQQLPLSPHTFSQRENLLSDELDRVFVLHPTFDQGERDQNRGSAGTHDIQTPARKFREARKTQSTPGVLPRINKMINAVGFNQFSRSLYVSLSLSTGWRVERRRINS